VQKPAVTTLTAWVCQSILASTLDYTYTTYATSNPLNCYVFVMSLYTWKLFCLVVPAVTFPK